MNQNSSVNNRPVINVDVPERLLSVIVGSFMIAIAFRRKRFSLTKAMAGGLLLYRGFSGHCPAYAMAGKKKLADPVKNINIRTTVTVSKPRSEVYAFWRRLDNLPLFMKHLESVEVINSNRSLWKAKVPGGLEIIEWEAEIVKEEDESLLGWNSLPGAAVENAGKVVFKDAGENETEVDVVITYRAPLGAAGENIARLLTPVFRAMVKADIRNFKRYIERAAIPSLKQ